MRVLVTTQPGEGHLQPMVALGQALQRAGHEVAVACAERFRPRAEAAGFRTFAAGLDWLESDVEKDLTWLGEAPACGDQPFRFMTEIFLDRVASAMVPDLLEICRSFEPDLLLRNDFEFGAPLVAEKLGLPLATVGIEFFMPGRIWRALLGSQLAHLRRSFGLSPRTEAELFYRDLYLSMIPPSYKVPEVVLPAVNHGLRPVLVDFGVASPPAWLDELDEGPKVYFTLGTVFNRSEAIFRAVLEGLEKLDVQVIATVGRNQDPARFGRRREGVRIERWVPQGLVLERCDLVVTHGGFNTTIAALGLGLPVLVVPIAAHQPFHAGRCVELGLGLALRPEGRFAEHFPTPAPEDLSPEAVCRAVRRLLDEEGFARRAAEMRREIAAMPAPEEVVERLVELVAERSR